MTFTFRKCGTKGFKKLQCQFYKMNNDISLEIVPRLLECTDMYMPSSSM